MRRPPSIALSVTFVFVVAACAASSPPRRPAQSGRRLLLADALIRFEERGPVGASATPWLLVHGLGGSLDDYRALMERFPRGERVIAVDLPGFGGSISADDEFSISRQSAVLGEVVDALALTQARFVCHSMGGQICIDFALRHPERIQSLTLIDSAGVYRRNDFLQRAAEGMTPIVVGRVDAASNPTIALLAGSQRPVLRRMTAGDAFLLSALDSFEHSYRSRLHELRVPVLVIWGTSDPLFSPDDAFVICASVEDCELHLVEGAGHSPHESHPETVMRHIRAFARAKGGRDA